MTVEYQNRFEFLRLEGLADFDENTKRELLSNLSDMEHMKFSRQSLVKHTEKTLKSYFDDLHSSGGLYYVIRRIHDHETIGTFTLNPALDNSCDVGILIFKKFSQMGAGYQVFYEIYQLVKRMGYKEMLAGCNISNVKMRRLCEKLGMTLDNRRNFPINKSSDISNIYFMINC